MIQTYVKQNFQDAATQGFSMCRMQLAAKASRQMNLRTPFKNGIPGKDWIYGFMARHPDLSLRTPILSTVRARMLNGPVVTN